MGIVLPIVIVAVIVAAAAVIFFTARRSDRTGELSRETKSRDQGTASVSDAESKELALVGAQARERAEDARDSVDGDALPAPKKDRAVTKYVPVEPEELGVTRREFLNRAILLVLAVPVLGTLSVALIGFLWPTGKGGFGGQITVGTKLPDILDTIAADSKPFYAAEARAYVVPYPAEDLDKANEAYGANVVKLSGMDQGIVALYQRCVHLGCRVPFCDSSQWFECPCHGSKYNRVGEKRGGPAPRGLDRFPVLINGDTLTIDTNLSTIIQGPKPGTDTTGQGAEGPPCV